MQAVGSGSDASSAFDRLYQRLVVQGRSPARKHKKNKKTEASAAPTTSASARESANPFASAQLPPTAHEGSSRLSPAEEEAAAISARAAACVRSLRLWRNMRAVSGLSRESTTRILASSGNEKLMTMRKDVYYRWRRRGRSSTGAGAGAGRVDCDSMRAQHFRRLEAIAARLYRRSERSAEATSPPPVGPVVEGRSCVLHDFCFAMAAPAFQSRAHYGLPPREDVVLPLPVNFTLR